MKTIRSSLGVVGLATALTLMAAPPVTAVAQTPASDRSASPVAGDAEIEAAMQAYESGSFAMAAHLFHRLAEQGDAHAQEILGMMYALGPGLYPGIRRDRDAAIRWLSAAARQGRPAAAYVHCAIVRNVPGTRGDSGTARCFASIGAVAKQSR